MGTEKIYQNIKEFRKQAGLSQKALGALVGKGESCIGAYETGENDMTVSTFIKIAEALKAKPEELINGKKAEKRTEWDGELRVYNLEDRLGVLQILAKNGYDVGQHSRSVTPTGKTKAYYIHYRLSAANVDSTK